MRVTITLLSLLLLPLVVGCEGNTPRRSPLAVTTSPSAAKTVEFAPQVKGATSTPRPAGQANPGNPAPTPDGGNVAVPGEANPAAGGPLKIDRNKLQERINELRSHTAIFLRSEVGALAGTGIQENNNFVFRPAEGLNKLRIIPLMDAWRATKGKPPQTPKELLRMLENDGNNVELGQLGLDEFYIYDPELAAVKKEEIDFLQQYP